MNLDLTDSLRWLADIYAWLNEAAMPHLPKASAVAVASRCVGFVVLTIVMLAIGPRHPSERAFLALCATGSLAWGRLWLGFHWQGRTPFLDLLIAAAMIVVIPWLAVALWRDYRGRRSAMEDAL